MKLVRHYRQDGVFTRKISSRCACEHGWTQTQKQGTCQCNVLEGVEQRFTVEPQRAVKWGAFYPIRTRLIWPRRLTDAPAAGGGVRSQSIERHQRRWRGPPSPQTPLRRVHYGLHDELLRSFIMKMQSINHGEYYSCHTAQSLWGPGRNDAWDNRSHFSYQ